MTRREFVRDSVAVVCAATVSRMMAISNAKGDIKMKKNDKSVLARWYNANPGGSLHDVYIGEIESVYEA